MRILEVGGDLAEAPAPEVRPLLGQLALEHVGHVLADDGEELEAVVGSRRGDVEVLGRGVGADAEVEVFGHAVPGDD